MQLRNLGAAARCPLQAHVLDEPPHRFALGIAKHAAARRQRKRLGGAASRKRAFHAHADFLAVPLVGGKLAFQHDFIIRKRSLAITPGNVRGIIASQAGAGTQRGDGADAAADVFATRARVHAQRAAYRAGRSDSELEARAAVRERLSHHMRQAASRTHGKRRGVFVIAACRKAPAERDDRSIETFVADQQVAALAQRDPRHAPSAQGLGHPGQRGQRVGLDIVAGGPAYAIRRMTAHRLVLEDRSLETRAEQACERRHARSPIAPPGPRRCGGRSP